jgi:two-component system, cell cycle sensor histidine kinase and response regulator CckA
MAFALAVVMSIGAVVITRISWPFFADTPLIALFAAVALTTHFGSGPAGLLALGLTTAASRFAFLAGHPLPISFRSLIVFASVGLLANRILDSRNRAEARLRRSEAEFRAVWEHAALGAALLSRRGQIERINPALAQLLGEAGGASTGTMWNRYTHPDDRAADHDRFARLMTDPEAFYQCEQRYQRADGTVFWGRVTVSAIRGHDTPTGALAILEDVTARRQAELELRVSEEQLRRAQKMQAIGQLAAGVAHNFNNLLTVTLGYVELMLERHPDQDQDRRDLEEIHKASERGATLTRQLLAFGRRHHTKPTRIDLNIMAEDLRSMLMRVIREDIQLTIRAAPRPAVASLDPDEIEQVLLNLVINARDALPMGGRIEVEIARQTIEATSGTGAVAEVPGEYVGLRVRDNGIGMAPDVQTHLFEPFFTTKEVGQGTGLGLAFVDGIVRHSHGFITVDSAPDKGTTIAVYFPCEGDAAPGVAPASPAVSTVHAASDVTILLVEDEAAVRRTTEGMLQRAGYRVLSAETPGAACALFDAHGSDIDLLVTDVIMPEMHGPALAQRLVAHRPTLRVLFVSGHSDVMPLGTSDTGRVAFLDKPFTSARLIPAIQSLLSAT